MGKFAAQASKFEVDLGALFNRAMRQALLAGLTVAVNSTKQDSSNAAAHWTIKAKGAARTGGRAWNRLRDMRQTNKGKRAPGIGKRRAGGIHSAEVLTFVRERELKDVIDKFIAGRKPATSFSFFNPIGDNPAYEGYIKESALPGKDIEAAGNAAVERTLDVLVKRIEAGKTRKRRL